jgi:putative transposase
VPQSLSSILLHIVFSTKHRARLIPAGIAPELHCYLAAVARDHGCPAHEIGGTEDHVHICCSLARVQSCAMLVEELKTCSSKWMKTKAAALAEFARQNGYGAFSIGEDQLAAVKAYIAKQPEHHATTSFQDELRSVLARHRVAFDERYVWD